MTTYLDTPPWTDAAEADHLEQSLAVDGDPDEEYPHQQEVVDEPVSPSLG